MAIDSKRPLRMHCVVFAVPLLLGEKIQRNKPQIGIIKCVEKLFLCIGARDAVPSPRLFLHCGPGKKASQSLTQCLPSNQGLEDAGPSPFDVTICAIGRQSITSPSVSATHFYLRQKASVALPGSISCDGCQVHACQTQNKHDIQLPAWTCLEEYGMGARGGGGKSKYDSMPKNITKVAIQLACFSSLAGQFLCTGLGPQGECSAHWPMQHDIDVPLFS